MLTLNLSRRVRYDETGSYSRASSGCADKYDSMESLASQKVQRKKKDIGTSGSIASTLVPLIHL